MVIADLDTDAGRTGRGCVWATALRFTQTDVSDVDQVQASVDFAVERFGGLDIMFNNAGIGSPLKRFLPDDLERFLPHHECQPLRRHRREPNARRAT